jgi:hypothetical protein
MTPLREEPSSSRQHFLQITTYLLLIMLEQVSHLLVSSRIAFKYIRDHSLSESIRECSDD